MSDWLDRAFGNYWNHDDSLDGLISRAQRAAYRAGAIAALEHAAVAWGPGGTGHPEGTPFTFLEEQAARLREGTDAPK